MELQFFTTLTIFIAVSATICIIGSSITLHFIKKDIKKVKENKE